MKKILFVLSIACLALLNAQTFKDEVGKKAFTKQNYPIKAHHDKLGFECKSCHTEANEKDYKALSSNECLSCHKDYKHLAKATGHLGYDDNVHASPHYPDMDCNTCHRSHTKSVNYCVMCHSQDSMKAIQVP